MKIRRHRMIHLGYGKHWRSDQIVGLLPIEEDRGPGRRTEVYVASREEPIVAARTHETILEEMVVEDGDGAPPGELRTTAADFLEALRGLSPMLRRMLKNEAGVDVDAWVRRLTGLIHPEEADDESQEELFRGV